MIVYKPIQTNFTQISVFITYIKPNLSIAPIPWETSTGHYGFHSHWLTSSEIAAAHIEDYNSLLVSPTAVTIYDDFKETNT